MEEKYIWRGFGISIGFALILTIFDTYRIRNVVKHIPALRPVVEQRAAGFVFKGELQFGFSLSKKRFQLTAYAFPTGAMQSDEVIFQEAQAFLVTRDQKSIPFGKPIGTFKDRWEQSCELEEVSPGSVIKIVGKAVVFKRREVKIERQMMPDGSVMLHMNTGTVHFSKLSINNLQQIQMETKDLMSVHEHGLELLALDKQTISGRVILKPGIQMIDRQTLPYIGRDQRFEPISVRQLIPRRHDPIELVLSIPNEPTPNQ